MRISALLLIGVFLAGGRLGALAKDADKLEVSVIVAPVEISGVAPGKVASIFVALKIQNLDAAPLLINKFATPAVEITGPDGVVPRILLNKRVNHLPNDPEKDLGRIPQDQDFYVLRSQLATYIPMECIVFAPSDSGDGNGPFFFGYISRDGANWQIGPLKKGTYHLRLCYTGEEAALHQETIGYAPDRTQKVSLWEGMIRTKPVELIIR